MNKNCKRILVFSIVFAFCFNLLGCSVAEGELVDVGNLEAINRVLTAEEIIERRQQNLSGEPVVFTEEKTVYYFDDNLELSANFDHHRDASVTFLRFLEYGKKRLGKGKILCCLPLLTTGN